MGWYCRACVVSLMVVLGPSTPDCRGDAPGDAPALRGWRSAVEAARGAAEAEPDNAALWKRLATAWLYAFRSEVVAELPEDEMEALSREVFDGAREAVSRAKALTPNDPEAHLMYAWLLAVDFADEDELGEQLKQGLAEAGRAAGLAPDDYFYQKAAADYALAVAAHWSSWARHCLVAGALLLLRAEDPDAARRLDQSKRERASRIKALDIVAARYEALIKRWPDNAELHLGLARVYGPGQSWPTLQSGLGRRPLMVKKWKGELRTAAELDPTNAFPLLQLAAHEADIADGWGAETPATHSAVVAATRSLLEEAVNRQRYLSYQPSYPKGWEHVCWTATAQLESSRGNTGYRSIARALCGKASRLQERGRMDAARELCRLTIAMGQVLTTSPDSADDGLTGQGIWYMGAWRLGETAKAADAADLRQEAEREMAAAKQWKENFREARPWLTRDREAAQERGTPAGT